MPRPTAPCPRNPHVRIINTSVKAQPTSSWRSNLWPDSAPPTSQTHVTDPRTAIDFAHFARFLAEKLYPDAEKIVLVTDNLNTHKIASFYEAFYEAFDREEARRLALRFEWHSTPEHGSWLNMAEIEFSILQKQALNTRLTRTQVVRAVELWQDNRNTKTSKINWHFTTQDARTRLRRLYPNPQHSTV